MHINSLQIRLSNHLNNLNPVLGIPFENSSIDDASDILPFIVANGVEQLHGLHHSVHLFIFCKNKIVAGQRDAEDDRCDALEAVDPLLALGPGEGETLWLR